MIFSFKDFNFDIKIYALNDSVQSIKFIQKNLFKPHFLFNSQIKINLKKFSSDEYLELKTANELYEYFSLKRKSFTVPLNPLGTEFQTRVWNELSKVRYGTTLSYAQLADRIGHTNAYRAVANALHANPIPILLPCHRIVSSGGKLGGFAYGIETKKFLLNLEGILE